MPSVILCVDDDHIALAVRRLLLSTRGYAILTAASANAALDLFNCNNVEVVITDHMLPDGTGAELTRQMKNIKPEVPVVLLTAWTDMPPGYDHADRLLSKGMTPEDFLTEVANLLSHQRSSTATALEAGFAILASGAIGTDSSDHLLPPTPPRS